MRATHYAKALYALSHDTAGKEMLVKNFVDTVNANGHAHMLPKITKAFEKILSREEKKNTIEVISNTVMSEAKVVTLLKLAPWKSALSASHKHVVRKTDETLIGGTVVRTGAIKIDGSYKRTLLDLYQSLISH